MDINSSYGSLQGLSSVQAGQLEKLSSASGVDQVSEESSGLVISDNLTIQKSSLSQNIENMNSGIAMTAIAQNGISGQKDILENIKAEVLKAMDPQSTQEGMDAAANKISEYIGQFKMIAQSTVYNNEQILSANGTIEDDISVVADTTIIPMEKADTASISDQLSSFVADFSTDEQAGSDLLKALDEGIDRLNIYADDYSSASKLMEQTVRDALAGETNAAASRSAVSNIDYAKESADFNKTNMQSQIGYLMQSQANAQQAKNIVLLS